MLLLLLLLLMMMKKQTRAYKFLAVQERNARARALSITRVEARRAHVRECAHSLCGRTRPTARLRLGLPHPDPLSPSPRLPSSLQRFSQEFFVCSVKRSLGDSFWEVGAGRTKNAGFLEPAKFSEFCGKTGGKPAAAVDGFHRIVHAFFVQPRKFVLYKIIKRDLMLFFFKCFFVHLQA